MIERKINVFFAVVRFCGWTHPLQVLLLLLVGDEQKGRGVRVGFTGFFHVARHGGWFSVSLTTVSKPEERILCLFALHEAYVNWVRLSSICG
jgi:hypothetical protein